MRIILVTFSNILPFAIENVLNSENEYRAIVVDDPKAAKKYLEKVPYSHKLIYPFYELPECMNNFYYDCVVCLTDSRFTWNIHEYFVKCNLSLEKFVHVSYIGSIEDFLLERNLRYYREHAEEIEMFATGISCTTVALENPQFKYKLLNFARSSQDLYYDYKIAEFILKLVGGGGQLNMHLLVLPHIVFIMICRKVIQRAEDYFPIF